MMKLLKDFLISQYNGRDRLKADVRFMIIDKSDLSVLATFNKDNIPLDLPDETLNKGIYQLNTNQALGCVMIVVTDIPKTEQMYIV